ncbi:MAG: IS4 family transposase, partial [Gammaproteobacteria bacterium]|nr:IS4 family transposase [Gammaproteobacteria bacterium]
MIKSATQSELNRFFQQRDQSQIPVQQVTAAAFCKARMKLSADAFIDLNRKTLQTFYQGITPLKWKGFRVLAVDGIKVHVPNEAVIHEEFGGQSNQYADVTPMAMDPTLYDVFQKTIIDAQLYPYRSDEREMAFQHLSASQKGDIVLYDRGYPAFWLMAAHQSINRVWCMRVKADFNHEVKRFVASKKSQQIVTFVPTHHATLKCHEKGLSSQPVKVRLMRVRVKKSVYYLITNLLDTKQFSLSDFKTLYHLRWQIEESYKRQKSWLEIENFTGKSVLSVLQDYHARILSYNLTTMTVYVAQGSLNPDLLKRQYVYQINFAQALSSMKDTLVKLL